MALIKVTTNEKQQQVVSAKELYLALGLDKSNWSSWYKKNIIDNQFSIENEDWVGFVVTTNGNETKDFVITLDFAKRLSMMARTKKGEEARKYFIECEKKLIEQQPKELTRLELLTMALESEQKRIEAERTVAILTHVNKTYTITEIAKELGYKSAKELNKTLNEQGIQFKINDTWVLYSNYSNLGYFDIKQEVLENGKVIYHRKVTQIGREFIVKIHSNIKNIV